MFLNDAESEALKAWVVKKLEDVSDADSDVLADYVLALVKSDEPDDQVKQNCLDNLEDFLKEHTASFVESVFAAIKTKSFDPNAAQPLAPTAPSFTPQAANGQYGQTLGKRSYQDDDVVMGEGGYQGRGRGRGGDRPMKQMRRGPREFNQRGGRAGSQGHMQQQQQSLPFPQLDPNNPLASLMAMQQAMGFQLPGMPPMPFSPNSMQQQGQQGYQPPKRPGKRCRDYDNKGFCARGTACPYDHVNGLPQPQGQAEEYDPTNANLDGNGDAQYQRSNDRGRGRGRGRGDRGNFRGGRGGRADFSSAGPNHDHSITAVVVENIPEEKFSEPAVREFFSEFGTIDEVTLQDYKRLAIIKYPDYDSAKRAYDSPKVIFDNRFVKVYWYKPDGLPRPRSGFQSHNPRNGSTDVEMGEENIKQEEEKIDPVELAKKQEEAQRLHEERVAQQKAAQSQREELEQKLKSQAEERSKLLAKLAAKEKPKTSDTVMDQQNGNGTEIDIKTENKSTSQTAALRAKLAELEAEALSMGIDPSAQAEGPSGFPPRGRGGFRGRGAWQPRGAYRGGRGGSAAPRGGAVMRLDNRPKSLTVVFPDGAAFDEGCDEGLKQFLLFNDLMESATIIPHPSRHDAALVSFTERYKAETFLASASNREIPHIGRCELSWAPNAQAPTTTAATAAIAKDGSGANGAGADVGMEGAEDGRNGESERMNRENVDYDVADDDDRWLVG